MYVIIFFRSLFGRRCYSVGFRDIVFLRDSFFFLVFGFNVVLLFFGDDI